MSGAGGKMRSVETGLFEALQRRVSDADRAVDLRYADATPLHHLTRQNSTP